MATKSKTIKLLLSDGTLQGLLVVEDSHWYKGSMLAAPRTSINELMMTKEVDQWGVYLLLSSEKVYVGQSNNLKKRITQHNVHKDWWEKAILLTTNDDSFNKADIDYLESYLIKKATNAGTLESDNKNTGNTPKVDRFREPELIQYIDEALLLLELIGITVFVPKKKKIPVQTINRTTNSPIIAKNTSRDLNKLWGNTYYFSMKGLISNVEFKSDTEFILKAGSLIQDQKTFSGPMVDKSRLLRLSFTQSGILKDNEILSDITFDSLSKVAIFINGGNVNGWAVMKDKNGNTIDTIAKS